MEYDHTVVNLLSVLSDLHDDGALYDCYGIDPEVYGDLPLEGAFKAWLDAARPGVPVDPPAEVPGESSAELREARPDLVELVKILTELDAWRARYGVRR